MTVRKKESGGNAKDVPAGPDPTMRMHLWFETQDGVVFGLGRLLLLQRVERCGSLKAAAEQLGMSYRAAWGKIRKTEQLLGRELIDRSGYRRSGCRLTPYGRELALEFSHWFRDVERYALSTSTKFLPFRPAPFPAPAEEEPSENGSLCVKINMLK